MKHRREKRVELHPETCGIAIFASRAAMQFRPSFLLLGLLALGAPAARATSVVPPSFPELVDEAEAIYRGRVTAVEARHVGRPDGGSVIKTFVTFAVDRVLKGPAQSEVVLQFLGGTIGDESLTVSGMPKFTLGSREIVFVQKNGVQFCPLVGVMHGRYRVVRDEANARELITRDNGSPLTDVAEVQTAMADQPEPVKSANLRQALTADAFESSIRSEVRRPSVHRRPD
jgi:hypothetical protein